MEIHDKVQKAVADPWYIIRGLASKNLLNFLSDRTYLKLMYYAHFQTKLNLSEPQTYNEKLQWLKLYHRNPEYTIMVDKYEVRDYIREKIGEKYLNTLLGVWKTPEEIDFEELPDKFVLKTTHNSGGYVICDNKDKLDWESAKQILSKYLNKNYFNIGREYPYLNVEPRVIAEEFLEQDNGEELRDYRFFCFNGEPKFVSVDFSITDKSRTRRNLYDLNWDLLEASISYPHEEDFIVNKPDKFEEMIQLSKQISKGIPHTRVDFYYINKQIIFGEITFYHQNGWGKFTPEEFNKQLGDWITLPEKQE